MKQDIIKGGGADKLQNEAEIFCFILLIKDILCGTLYIEEDRE